MTEEQTAEMLRTMGRVEGGVEHVAKAVEQLRSDLRSDVTAIRAEGVAAKAEQGLVNADVGRRLSSLERQVWQFAGAAGVIGVVAGFAWDHVHL